MRLACFASGFGAGCAAAGRRALAALGAFALAAALAGKAAATDFIRGDANGDGVVSIADAHFVQNVLFRGGTRPSCLDTADIDDDSRVNISDTTRILHYLFDNGQAPATPFPEAGPDPAEDPPDMLDCESYGGGEPLADPAARVEILEATAAGGEDSVAMLVLGISSSTSLAGFSVTLSFEGGIAASGWRGFKDSGLNERDIRDVSSVWARDGYGVYTVHPDGLRLGILSTLTGMDSMPESDAVVPVVELAICLAEGTTAGEYAVTVEEAELVDFASGRRIVPAVSGRTITVASDLGPGVGCPSGDFPPRPEPGDPPLPPPDGVEGTFELSTVDAVPGGAVEVPVSMSANADIQGFSLSIDYDEEILASTGIDQIHNFPASGGFKREGWNSDNDNPGENGFDEGYFWAAWVFSFSTPTYNLPAGEEHHVLSLEFDVREGAVAGESAHITFVNGAPSPGQPVINNLTAAGQAAELITTDAIVTVNGSVKIIGEITIFVRGDANGDAAVDLADAQATLGWLFLDGRALHCLDAADANDDGRVNIADPIATLNFLFLGGPELPGPTGEPGEDPTPDGLGCQGEHT